MRLSKLSRSRPLALLLVAATGCGVLLAAPAAEALTDPDGERISAGLVDRARAARGLDPLRVCTDLREVARRWSAKMASEGRLTHNPNLAATVSGWRHLHENVGWDSAVERVHDRFMASSGHRAHVLSNVATEVGVGVERRDGRTWVTQVYREPDGAPCAAVTIDPRITTACPPAAVPPATFADIYVNIHRDAVDCITWYGIGHGRSAERYAPSRAVTRGQMASFLVRLLEHSGVSLPDAGSQGYTDIAGSSHAGAINRLRAAGLVHGTSATTFDPAGRVTREQMASLLVRTYEHTAGETLPTGSARFTDMSRSAHGSDVNRAAQAGFVSGITASLYAPHRFVRRDQLASFIARALDVLVARGHTVLP